MLTRFETDKAVSWLLLEICFLPRAVNKLSDLHNLVGTGMVTMCHLIDPFPESFGNHNSVADHQLTHADLEVISVEAISSWDRWLRLLSRIACFKRRLSSGSSPFHR